MVDEYQDLNRAQERLLSRLIGMGANLAVVGDDDQAIYQWRGGDVGLFVGFEKRYRAEVRKMGENRRSTPSIVGAAAAFAGTIKDRVAKDVRPSRTEEGQCIEMLWADDAAHEARTLARRVKALLESGQKPGDVAVLYRSVRTSAGPLIQAFIDERIPASVVGRVSLLDRPETRLVARAFVLMAGGTWYPDDDRRPGPPREYHSGQGPVRRPSAILLAPCFSPGSGCSWRDSRLRRWKRRRKARVPRRMPST